jgi:hypothetical protein
MRESDQSVPGLIQAVSASFVEMTLDDPRATRIGFIEAWNSEALMRLRVQTLHGCATAPPEPPPGALSPGRRICRGLA